VEFGKHIGKGLWAFADKALPAIYGVGFIFLVIRVLPEKEYGAFVIIQTIFTFATALGYALAFQPLTKFAAESEDNGSYIFASLILTTTFYALVCLIIFLFKNTIVLFLDSTGQGNLSILTNYLPLLFFTSLYRGFAVSLLQATYEVRKIFWIDAVYFLGTLVLLYTAQTFHRSWTAEAVITSMIMAQAGSTVLALFLTRKEMSVKLEWKVEALSQMWNYGKYTFGGNSIYVLFSQMDVVFVSSVTGVLGVAVYNAAKILTRVFDMLGQVLQMFLIPFSSKTYKDNDIDTLRVTAEKSVCFTTLLVIPIFLIMFFFPEQALHILYKGKYDHGASLVRVFSVLALVVPLNAVLASYIIGIGKVKQAFYYSLGFIALAFIGFLILTPMLGGLGASIAFVTSFLIITIVLFKYIQHLVPFRLIDVVKRTRDAWTFVRTQSLFSLK
jgi:O-antigen/teichoic acid export membrane protein